MLRIRSFFLSILIIGISLAADAANAAGVAASALGAGNAKFGAGLGAGIVVIGAGFGIGLMAFAAANATARQPEAAADIRATVNLPLFLLEGVAIIALVVCILAVVL